MVEGDHDADDDDHAQGDADGHKEDAAGRGRVEDIPRGCCKQKQVQIITHTFNQSAMTCVTSGYYPDRFKNDL